MHSQLLKLETPSFIYLRDYTKTGQNKRLILCQKPCKRGFITYVDEVDLFNY